MTSRSAGVPGRARRALAAALTVVVLAGLPADAAAVDPGRGSRPPVPEATSTPAPVATPAPSADSSTPAAAQPAPSAVPPVPASPVPDLRAHRVRPGDAPSQMYLDTVAAERRAFHFTPGGRVTVGFRPRADDGWPVDGRAPRALPAGRVSGATMAADAAGAAPPSSTRAPVPGAAEPSPAPVAAPSPAAEEPSPATGPTPADQPAPTPAPIQAETAAFVAPPAEASLAPAAVGMRREVYGFLPYWEVADSDTRLDFSVITHLAYFSVGADAKGNLRKRNSDGSLTTGWAGWTSSRMTSIINAAHQQRSRVTLTISVFAWSSGQASVQKALLGSSTARLNLARQAVAAVRDRGADGINLDFEPLVSGYEDEFVALVRTIRAELSKVAAGYHLSFDTLGYPGNYPLEGALASGGADAVFVMGYDYRTAGAAYAGSIDPLAGPAYDLTDTVRTYTARVPASRVILGIPYYGRAWSTVSDAVNARTQSGTKYGTSNAVNYEIAVQYAADHGRRYDSREVSAWVAYRKQSCTSAYGCVTTWRQIYYDDAATLKARYDLVNRAGLRGAGIWALGYDGTRRELYRALADKFLNDTTPPRAGIVAFDTAARPDVSFVVRWTAADDWSGIASYDVQVSKNGGSWTTWLTGTRASTGLYYGDDNAGYAFRVRARDGKGNVSAWNVGSVYAATPALARGGFVRVVSDALNLRSAPSTGASRLATAANGDVYAVTGGPVAADGYAWYELKGPLTTWAPVGDTDSGVWAAVSGSGVTNAVAVRAPNSTFLRAGVRWVAFSGVSGSVGTSTAAVGARSFSPNGDGLRDGLAVAWNNRRAFDAFAVRVHATDGTLLGSRALGTTDAGTQSWTWDGTAGGEALPDGTYVLQLVGTEGSATSAWPGSIPTGGNLVALAGVRIDRVPPTIAGASLTGWSISPNGDGRHDATTITAAASADATSWEVLVRPIGASGVGAPVRRLAGSGSRATARWDGRDDAGSRVADGRYRLDLRFLDAARNPAQKSFVVTADASPPVLAVTATPGSFSPNGDGVADTVRLAWTASEAATGTLRVLRGTTLVRSWSIGGTGGSVTWDGRDAGGRLVADGRLSITVSAADRLANRGTATGPIVVDRTIGWLRWSPYAFYPQDGDRLAATSTLSVRVARTARLSLRILDAAGAQVRGPWASRSVAAGTATFRWDGRTATGGWVRPGRYVAELTAVGPYGTTRLRRSIVVDAFVATPSTSAPKAGTRLTVTFRAVEPLAAAPTATFTQRGRDPVKMAITRLADGSWRASVVVASGAPGTATVRIDGRDTGGGRNRTTLTLTVP